MGSELTTGWRVVIKNEVCTRAQRIEVNDVHHDRRRHRE